MIIINYILDLKNTKNFHGFWKIPIFQNLFRKYSEISKKKKQYSVIFDYFDISEISEKNNIVFIFRKNWIGIGIPYEIPKKIEKIGIGIFSSDPSDLQA